MTTPIPPGREGLIPHLVCGSCEKAIEFYKQAFGAKEVGRMPSPDGRIMHAEIEIDGLMVFLVDDFPEYCGGKSQTPQALGGTPVTIHRYVEDCDATIKQAVEAGATPMMPVQDMFWGDRYGSVIDPFGHCWSVATHNRDLTHEEIVEGMQAAFDAPHEQGAPG
ncbi:MAG: VOC family protein [Planctomycetota bacterium]|nr:MAG: VOC family protein [Planctomycetota bacterium]